MQAIDLNGDLGEYLLDENRKINNTHLNSVCLFKQGSKTCRYISLTVQGYVCMKKSPIKKVLDQKVKENKMKAKGDNCEGFGCYNPREKFNG